MAERQGPRLWHAGEINEEDAGPMTSRHVGEEREDDG